MKIIKQVIGIIILAFLASWFIGYIEINGATFNVIDASATTYWDYDEEDGDPFPIIPTRSKQVYEDGFVGLSPDFEAMLNEYLAGETIVGITSTFNDGIAVSSEGTDYNICIYPENLSISKTKIKAFHNLYEVKDKNIFEFEYKVPYYGRHRYSQTHSIDFNLEVEVNGIVSKEYLNYKLKELYLYYMLDAIRSHVQADEQFLKRTFLDTLDNLMFVKDNFEITKDEFLNLNPSHFAHMDWLPSRASMDLYTEDEECIGILLATSK